MHHAALTSDLVRSRPYSEMVPIPFPTLDLRDLREAFAAGSITPTALIRHLYPKLAETNAVFIHLVPLAELEKRCAELEAMPLDARGTLWGVPFAVKDNVDVAGVPTTAACPAFQYVAAKSAPAVEAILGQGAIMVGKTNMDQFAAGLVGTRSPYGAPSCPFDHRFITGGSSSGSGAAVGGGLVSFALGTDTAGSGRVPAGFNGCVGMKPTVGSVSTVGVVPACASLDCLTVFTRSVEDGCEVMRVMRSAHAGPDDVWRRPPMQVPVPPAVGFKFGVPSKQFVDWTSPGGVILSNQCEQQFSAAIDRLKSVGGVQVEVDFEPLCTIAAMLYGTSFVAERYSGIRKFLEGHKGAGFKPGSVGAAAEAQLGLVTDARLLPVTRHIIAGSGKFTAADVFDHTAAMAVLRARALVELQKVDVLLVPTALAHYTIQEVTSEESRDTPGWSQNANLGRFTNFVNLLDMCGVAVPSGLVSYDQAEEVATAGGPESAPEAVVKRLEHLKATGSTRVTLPFGVTLLSVGWRDEWLWGVAAAMQRAAGLACGPEGHGVLPYPQAAGSDAAGSV